MEKSSEKIISHDKLTLNPFNNLLSEVHIRLNHPKATNKNLNYALEMDPNIDRSNSNYNNIADHL
jgi:hypothetical protein